MVKPRVTVPPLPRRKLADEQTDKAIRETQEAVRHVAKAAAAAASKGRTLSSLPHAVTPTERIRLVNGVITKIPHGLGFRYSEMHVVSLIPVTSGASGHVEEVLVDASGVAVDPGVEVWVRLIGFGGADADVKLRVT